MTSRSGSPVAGPSHRSRSPAGSHSSSRSGGRSRLPTFRRTRSRQRRRESPSFTPASRRSSSGSPSRTPESRGSPSYTPPFRRSLSHSHSKSPVSRSCSQDSVPWYRRVKFHASAARPPHSHSRSRSRSRSSMPDNYASPACRGRSQSLSGRSRSPSPAFSRSRSPSLPRSRSRSPSEARRRSQSPSPARSRSRSPSEASDGSRSSTPARRSVIGSSRQRFLSDVNNESEDSSESSHEIQQTEFKKWCRDNAGARPSKQFGLSQRFQFTVMRKSKVLTDMQLRCGKQSFPCHKLILASSSAYFERMFQSAMKEVESSEVMLEVMTPDVLSIVLDYMYTANINFTWKKIPEILRAADYLQMDSLKAVGSEYLMEHIRPSTALHIHRIATMCNLPHIKRKAWHLIMQNFVDVVGSSDFVRLSSDELVEIIKTDKMNIGDEDPVLHAVLKWTHHRKNDRKAVFLNKLLPLVRLSYCSKYYLVDAIENEELLSSKDCQVSLAKAVAKSVKTGSSHSFPPRYYFLQQCRCLVLYASTMEDREDPEGFTTNGTMWYLDQDPYKDTSKTCDWKVLEDLNPQYPRPLHKESASFCNQTEYSLCALPSGLFLSGGKKFLSSNHEAYSITSRVAIFHFESLSWEDVDNMPERRHKHASVYINDAVIVVGGGDGGIEEWTAEMFYYDMQDGRWRPLSVLIPHRVHDAATVALGMNVYVFGGENPSYNFTNYTQIFNTCLYRWQRGAPMPQSPECATAVALKDNIYVVGGLREPVCMSYSPRVDSWSVLQPPMFHHAYAAAIVYQGSILLCGGEYIADGDIGVHNQIEAYDPAKNQWNKPKVPSSKLPKGLSHVCLASGYYRDITAGAGSQDEEDDITAESS